MVGVTSRAQLRQEVLSPFLALFTSRSRGSGHLARHGSLWLGGRISLQRLCLASRHISPGPVAFSYLLCRLRVSSRREYGYMAAGRRAAALPDAGKMTANVRVHEDHY
jgi:hypothetical protein